MRWTIDKDQVKLFNLYYFNNWSVDPFILEYQSLITDTTQDYIEDRHIERAISIYQTFFSSSAVSLLPIDKSSIKSVRKNFRLYFDKKVPIPRHVFTEAYNILMDRKKMNKLPALLDEAKTKPHFETSEEVRKNKRDIYFRAESFVF